MILDAGNPNMVMTLAGNKADLTAKRKVELEVLVIVKFSLTVSID